MVSRQETARPLLTPGEVMQMSQDDAVVLVSGLSPVRAKKLRHYQDANFTSRLLAPPSLVGVEYPDRPQPRTDDWQGQARPVDQRPSTLPVRDPLQSVDDDGGLKPQLALFDEAAPDRGEALSGEEQLFEDEPDTAADRSQMQRAAGAAGGTLQRAHAVARDDDDLLPAF
jgi:type IV secretion system protein VirD4